MADDLKQTTKQRFNVDHEVKYWAEWCLPPAATQHHQNSANESEGDSPILRRKQSAE
jgi:hypothetical protein